MSERRLSGLVGSFASADAVTNAARQLHSMGFRRVEAYTPYPVEGLDQVLRPGRRTLLPLVIGIGAIFGAVWGYFIQYWDEALNYPINVGGRPYNSWPAFIVGTFEFTVLCAIAAGFFGLLAACRLPHLYDPIFEAPEFERASVDRFLLWVGARDPSFEPHRIRRILERYGAERVSEVPA
ncbi:MAG: DUF3341 domain-containing protein [Stellaceae bacterium]